MTKDGKLTKDALRFDQWLKSRGMTRVQTYIDKALFLKFKLVCQLRGVTVQESIERHMKMCNKTHAKKLKEMIEAA